MSEPNIPDLEAPEQADAPDKLSGWDLLDEPKYDEDSGELMFSLPDEPAQAETSDGTSAEPATPELPAEGGDPALRAWATQVSMERAELRRELEQLKASIKPITQEREDADAAQSTRDLAGRIAAALPQDLSDVIGDRNRLVNVIAVTADQIAEAKLKTHSKRFESLQAELTQVGQALAIVAAISPDTAEVAPFVGHVVKGFASENNGANIFDHYSQQEVVQVARQLHAQHKQQAQGAPATTATDKPATPAPKTAASAPRGARPEQRAAAAASVSGVGVGEKDATSLGRGYTSNGDWNRDVRSIVTDVIEDAIRG